MARDLGEQERAFIDSLKEESGRDLSGWMAAISASGFTRRNDIIDWLRQQGFAFANASWLERIHNNEGQPIYGFQPETEGSEKPGASVSPSPRPATIEAERKPETSVHPSTPPEPSAPSPTTSPRLVSLPTSAASAEAVVTASQSKLSRSIASSAKPSESKPPQSKPAVGHAPVVHPPVAHTPIGLAPAEPTSPSTSTEDEIATLLAGAKGLRPLAELVLREMGSLVPTLRHSANPPLITMASPMPFAALLAAPKDIRLFADFGPASRDRTRKADTGRMAAPFPDVLVLNDARQIDDRFRELITQAYTRALS